MLTLVMRLFWEKKSFVNFVSITTLLTLSSWTGFYVLSSIMITRIVLAFYHVELLFLEEKKMAEFCFRSFSRDSKNPKFPPLCQKIPNLLPDPKKSHDYQLLDIKSRDLGSWKNLKILRFFGTGMEIWDFLGFLEITGYWSSKNKSIIKQ